MDDILVKNILEHLKDAGMKFQKIIIEYEKEGFIKYSEYPIDTKESSPDCSGICQSLQIWSGNIHIFINNTSFMCSNYDLLADKAKHTLEKDLSLKYIKLSEKQYRMILDSESRFSISSQN